MAAAAMAMMVPGIAIAPAATPPDTLELRQPAMPRPAQTNAIPVSAREEDVRLTDAELRELIRGNRLTTARQHRSPGDRAHKRWKQRRRRG